MNNTNKNNVGSWEQVATFVSTFADDSATGEGACDVSVEIGEDDGTWYIRTTDDAGGSDDGGNDEYPTREAAEAAAIALAEVQDRADGEGADLYLQIQANEMIEGGSDDDGEWCVYWDTSLNDRGPRERFSSQTTAQAAADRDNATLAESHCGYGLLCGYSVRRLVDGEWVQEES